MHVSHVHVMPYHQHMTASSEHTPTPAYRTDGVVPTAQQPMPTYTTPTYSRHQVPTWLATTTHALLCLACLCVLLTTAVSIYVVLALGHALSQVGDRLDAPTPAVSCDPTYYNC
jgi:hypothetical protein